MIFFYTEAAGNLLVVAVPTVVCGRASFCLTMVWDFGSISVRSAVPGVIVFRKTPDDVSEFVKHYYDLCLRGVPAVVRNH